MAINSNGDKNMTKVDSYTLQEGQKIVCRIEATKEVSFAIDGSVVLRSTQLNLLDKDLKNIKFVVLNHYPSNKLKLNWIKSTSNVGLKTDVPEQPIFKNSKGEILVKNKTFPDIGDEFG